MAALDDKSPQATRESLRRGLLRAGAWVVASALGVRGLEYTRDPVNNVIAALLDLFVVVPALVGAFAWAWGLGGRR